MTAPKMGFSTGVRSRAKTSPMARTKASSVVRSMPKLRSGIFEETITGITPKTAAAQKTVQRTKQKSMSAALLGGFPNFPDVLPRFSVPAVPAFGAGGSIFHDTMMKPGRRVKPGKAEYKPSLGGLLFDVRKKKVPKRLTGFEPIRPMRL